MIFEWLSDGLTKKKKGERNVWKDFFEVIFVKFGWYERMDWKWIFCFKNFGVLRGI